MLAAGRCFSTLVLRSLALTSTLGQAGLGRPQQLERERKKKPLIVLHLLQKLQYLLEQFEPTPCWYVGWMESRGGDLDGSPSSFSWGIR